MPTEEEVTASHYQLETGKCPFPAGLGSLLPGLPGPSVGPQTFTTCPFLPGEIALMATSVGQNKAGTEGGLVPNAQAAVIPR